MNNQLKEFINYIFSLNRYVKRYVAMTTDVVLCIFCTWLAFFTRSEYWRSIKIYSEILNLFDDFNFNSALLSVVIAIPIFWLFGLYRTIFRYTGFSIFFDILMSSLIYGIIYFTIGVYIIQLVPRPIGFVPTTSIIFCH